MEDLDGATRQDEPSAINTKDLMIQAQDEWDVVSEVMDRSVQLSCSTPERHPRFDFEYGLQQRNST